jgi:hypothetical protein
MNDYIVTSEEDSMAYAVTYLIKLFRAGFSFDCSGGISFLPRDFIPRSPKQVSQSSQDLSDIIKILIQLLGDADEAVAVLEIIIDSDTIQSEWEDGDYFEAGLYAGKGSVNAAYTFYGIIKRYIQTYLAVKSHL